MNMNVEASIPNVTVKTVSLEELCEQIFREPPKNPWLCPIAIDETSDSEFSDDEKGLDIFYMLCDILLTGVKVKFGTDADGSIVLSNLTMQDFEMLNKYMHSMGYHMTMITYPLDQHSPTDIEYNPQDFTTMQMTFQSKNGYFVEIRFTKLEPKLLDNDIRTRTLL